MLNIGIKADDLKTGNNGAIEALCEKAGEDAAQVLSNTALLTGKRQYSLRGQAVSVEFLSSPKTKYCPLCLLEDDQHDVGRTGRCTRLVWTLRGVRTCPEHAVAFEIRSGEAWDDKFQNVNCAERFPADLLRAQAQQGKSRQVSSMQSYLVDRLSGADGPSWLDSQSIEQAQWVTEMLGAVVAFGSGITLDKLSEDDWDKAGRVGYAYTSAGEAGVWQAMEKIFSSFEYSAARPGPQKFFGPLYTSLAAKRAVKDRGPIVEILREFIF